jgi:hypothetical protein
MPAITSSPQNDPRCRGIFRYLSITRRMSALLMDDYIVRKEEVAL